MNVNRFMVLAREILPDSVFRKVNKAVTEYRDQLRNGIPVDPPYAELLELIKPVYIRRAGVLRDMLEQGMKE